MQSPSLNAYADYEIENLADIQVIVVRRRW